MMEETINTPENGSSSPVSHHFAKYIQCKHSKFVRFIYLRSLTSNDPENAMESRRGACQPVVPLSTSS
jgi:hypothetical protein